MSENEQTLPDQPEVQVPSQGRLEIKLDDLRKERIFIATPCYGGMLTEAYFRSTIKLLTFCNQHGIPIAFGTIANESLVTRARNVLVAYFLQSNYTRLMFIDADIEFQVEDVLKLIAHNKELAVGAYPKKGVNWQRIRDSVRNDDSDFNDGQISAFGSDYAINFKFVNREAKQIAIENGLIRLHDGATGFMMIKRSAIDKMIAAYPELKYNNDLNTPPDLQDYFYCFFDTMLDPKDKRYLSEDYTFCRRWQAIGGECWLDPTISLNHFGSFCFVGNPQQIIQLTP
ncbi:MAG: hypothetical protein EBU90_07695 [Proteobacteria bacterium]|nr:hypothetical protein [Pseudomonadota bacterium]NBP13415.1 hypothetical protein [bacterium]